MPRANPKLTGLLTVEDLRKRVQAGEIDTVLVVFTDHYGRFMGKRFDAQFFLDSALDHGAEACNYLLTVDMEMNPIPGYQLSSWELGYGDFHLRPDLATLRAAAWLDRSALVICDVMNHKTHEPIGPAPRNILRRQLERAAKLGFTAMAGSELEYYLFETNYREAGEKGYENLKPAGWYLEDYHMLQGARTEPFHARVRRHLRDSGVPVETSKGEWGKGQHELNIRYAETLDMADRHAIYKQCLKETADRMGLAVTFMAKLDHAQAGSSCHMHLSLWRKGRSAFPGSKKLGDVACSDVFRHFLAGWIAHARELMICYAPTVNSYKRYQSLSWAPTRLAWSVDNRTAGFRVVGEGESLRIECRIPGADCNPYLAYAAALASGLDGIERKLEPDRPFSGDMYAATDIPRVPATLREAADLFAKSKFARAAFGDDVVEHYLHFVRTEQDAFDGAVTDWERKRYDSKGSDARPIAKLRMTAASPIIGITTYPRDDRGRFNLPAEYVMAVQRAGGVPVLIPPAPEHASRYLDLVDGVVLAGGGDIGPQHYRGSVHELNYGIDADRDALELALARELMRRRQPTLAICRGLQVFNVAHGGSLIEHLPAVVGDRIAHRKPPRDPVPHAIAVAPGSRLASVLGATDLQPMSWHHQAIRDVAPGFEVVARAPDGTIEAVELPNQPWLLAVQWHPELTAHQDPAQQRLFDALVAATKS